MSQQPATPSAGRPVPGGGRVQIGDIRAKLSEIDREVRATAEVERPSGRSATLAAVGAGLALVVAAYVLGRRRGRRKSTWVEIRRL